MLRMLTDCCWFAVLGGGLLCWMIAPLPESKVKCLEEADLAGSWVMGWGGCDWTTRLGPNGIYSAVSEWETYSGTWHVRDGRLWITESNRPDDFDSYITYEIGINRATLKGPITSANGERRPGTTVIEFTRGK